MGKHYLIYLVFLLPALIVSLFFHNDTGTSVVLRWFFGFFLLIGFAVNTASASYRYPRGAMSFILLYTGVNLLIVTAFYASAYNSALYLFLRDCGGALSYVPLGIMVDTLRDFHVQQEEVVVTFLVAGCCLFGYVAGLVHRRVRPDPCSPRIG